MEHLLLGSTKEDSVCTYLACLYLRCITETRCQDQRSLTSQHSSLSAASSAPDSTEKAFLGSMLRASEDCWKSDLFRSGRLQAEPCGWQLLSRLASGQTKSWSLATTTWAPDDAPLSQAEKTEGRGRRTRGYQGFTGPDWPIRKQNGIPLKLEGSQAQTGTYLSSEIFQMHWLTTCRLMELQRARAQCSALLPLEKPLCYFCSQNLSCCVLTTSASDAFFLLLKQRMDLLVARSEPETAGPQSPSALKPPQHGPRSVEEKTRQKGIT